MFKPSVVKHYSEASEAEKDSDYKDSQKNPQIWVTEEEIKSEQTSYYE